MTDDLSALDAPPVRALSGREKISGQAGGGGKTIVKKNVDCMYLNGRLKNLL